MKWIVFGIVVGILVLTTVLIGVLMTKAVKKLAKKLGISEKTVRELEKKHKLKKLMRKKKYTSALRIAELEAQISELKRKQ